VKWSSKAFIIKEECGGNIYLPKRFRGEKEASAGGIPPQLSVGLGEESFLSEKKGDQKKHNGEEDVEVRGKD